MLAPERGAMVRVFPIAAATRGSKGEAINDFAALKSAGAVAVTDDGHPILKDSIMRETLRPLHAWGSASSSTLKTRA